MQSEHNRNNLYAAFSLAVGFLLLAACATSLEDYTPHSPQEVGVRDLLIQAEDAWNRRDVAAFAALLEKHATFAFITDGGVVDKQTFVEALPQKMRAMAWDFGPPEITVQGRKAFVYMKLKNDPDKSVLFFTLRRKNGRWRILAIR